MLVDLALVAGAHITYLALVADAHTAYPVQVKDLMAMNLFNLPDRCSTPVFAPTEPSYSFDNNNNDLSIYRSVNNM